MPADMNVIPVRQSVFPEHPGAWAWSRAKVYLAVVAFVVVGFFFVASWMAAPGDSAAFGRWDWTRWVDVPIAWLVIHYFREGRHFSEGRQREDGRSSPRSTFH